MRVQNLKLYDLMSLGKTSISITHSDKTIDPETSRPYEIHIHHCYEIYLNLAGDVSFLVNDKVIDIVPGTLIFARPGEIHHCIPHSACIHDHFCLWFDSDDEDFLALLRGFPDVFTFEGEQKDEIISLFYKLSEKGNGQGSLSRLLLFLQIIDLLSLRKEQPAVSTAGMPETLAEIIAYMNTEFTSIRNLNEVLARYHISHTTLNRWFHDYIKLSPTDFLQAKKLAYSKQLLHIGYSVTEAGYASGFSDCAYFISVFKKYYGQTPLQYKKSH